MKIYNLTFLLLFLYPFASPVIQQKLQHHKSVAENIIFRSADGGQTWQDISEGLPENVQPVALVEKDNAIYVRAGNGIFHSKPNSTAPFWEKEVFPNDNSSIAPGRSGIFAYNYDGQFLQRMNGADKWSVIYSNFHVNRVRNIFETGGGNLFIGSDNGLFKSVDNGKNWKQVYTEGWVMKCVESNGVLLAASQRGIIRSTDAGENWELVISEGGVGIDVECIKGGFAAINYSTAANTRRIRTSYDAGKNWQPIDAGLQAQTMTDSSWSPMHAGNPAQGTDSVWHPEEAAPPALEYKTSIIQVGENFFCGHTDGIYKTSNKGITWELVLPSQKGKMFKLSVSGNVIYAIQMESHC